MEINPDEISKTVMDEMQAGLDQDFDKIGLTPLVSARAIKRAHTAKKIVRTGTDGEGYPEYGKIPDYDAQLRAAKMHLDFRGYGSKSVVEHLHSGEVTLGHKPIESMTPDEIKDELAAIDREIAELRKSLGSQSPKAKGGKQVGQGKKQPD